MIAAAIDPGVTGGIAILSNPPQQFVTPLIGGKVDWREYAILFDKLKDCYVVLEEVHSVFNSSAKANFTFGGMFYSALCLLHAKGIVHDLVPPKTWQAEIWTNTDKVFVTKKNKRDINVKRVDPKATSLLSARRLFPEISFLYGDNETVKKGRRVKPHSGILDAYLMAEYCRRKYV